MARSVPTNKTSAYTLASLLIMFVLGFACNTAAIAQSSLSEGPVEVTPEEAAQLLAQNPDIVVLDVRTPVEFYISHIENAVNVNYYSFTFKSKIRKLDRSKIYLLHCQTGVRSGKTLPIMVEAGFTKIYHMTDGFKAWENAELPTT